MWSILKKEDEFDLKEDLKGNKNLLDQEDEEIDIVTMDNKNTYFSDDDEDIFYLPVVANEDSTLIEKFRNKLALSSSSTPTSPNALSSISPSSSNIYDKKYDMEDENDEENESEGGKIKNDGERVKAKGRRGRGGLIGKKHSISNQEKKKNKKKSKWK